MFRRSIPPANHRDGDADENIRSDKGDLLRSAADLNRWLTSNGLRRVCQARPSTRATSCAHRIQRKSMPLNVRQLWLSRWTVMILDLSRLSNDRIRRLSYEHARCTRGRLPSG